MSETIIPLGEFIETTSEFKPRKRKPTTLLRETVLLGAWIILASLVSLSSFAQEAAVIPSQVQSAEPRSASRFKAMGAAVRSHMPQPIQGFMDNFYDISVGITATFLMVALYWSVTLRRKVREQTIRIREQVARETRLEQRYRQLFENANDIVCSVDLEGRLLTLNQAGERVFGSSRQALTGLNFKDFLSPQSHNAYNTWLTDCKAGKPEPRCELETIAKCGESSVLEVSGRLLSKDVEIPQVEAIARDMTERKRAEQALRESEERFSSAFRVSPVAIALCTRADERLLDVNESFLKLLGYTHSEVQGRTTLDLNIWENPNDCTRLHQLLNENQRVAGLECRFRTKNGSQRIALVFVEPIDVGRIPCVLFISYDMTERLSLEAQLRQALKMEAIGRLAAGVAHDFNNLLVIIQGNAEVALMKGNGDADQTKRFDRIADAAQRAANLVRQLLTFSRKQVVQPRPLNLNELITNLTKMMKHLMNEEMVLKFAFASNLPIVQADPTMMEQILMNLSVNARDAMPKGGTFTIGTSLIEIDRTYVATRPESREGTFVCLSVADTGCGMDAATLARIFEPFFTTKEAGKGTGLGLATVYGIVKQHNGWIDVSSTPGLGSTFNVFFPCSSTAASPAPLQSPRSTTPGQETILVVEDEPDVVELVRSILQDKGYRALEATSALKAMEVWSAHAHEIDLVLTDIRMPKGMSGYELAQNLWALRPDVKILFTSGYHVDASGFNIELQDGVNFLAKPYPPRRLLEVVRQRLDDETLATAA